MINKTYYLDYDGYKEVITDIESDIESDDVNCNYCDQPLRLDNNNRCICCGAQK